MLNLKEIKIEETRTEVINEYEMVDRYYWCSRSVFAVEFKKNIYPNSSNGEVWNKTTLIEVKFEKNIILSYEMTFCNAHPITTANIRESWAKELMYAYTQEDKYYDYRTKEQFDLDFNTVINNLQELRKI